MKRKQISTLVTAMFAGVGILGAGIAHATGSANFVDRGNPDNALTGQCIDGTNPLCVATKNGSNVATSTASYTAGNNAQAGLAGIAIGDRANANSKDTSGSGGGATAIGTGAQAVANSATAIGTVALAQGNTSLAIGRQSAAIGDYSMALGNVADAHGTSSIALGHSALAQGDRSVAIGGANPTTSDGVSAGASYDAATQTRAAGTQSVAIGAGAQTNGDNQIAIGSGSVGVANNTSKPVFGGTAAPVGGAVSFGSLGNERQLKNVAAGVDATDAVNISQLKSVNDGLTTSINAVDARVTTLNTTIGGQITNINASLSTATSNITNLQAADKQNVKYTDSTHSAISLDGSGGTTIRNVKAGVASTDATNVGQLNAGLSTVQGNVNTQISNLGSSLSTSIINATKDAVLYDSSKHDSVTFGGTGATSPVALHNVAAGTADADAVNVKQLNSSIGTAVAPINQNITNIQTSLSTTNQTVANLSTSVTNINTSLSTATSDITQLQQADTRNVKYDGQSGFDTVTLQGSNGTTIKNVADGKDAHDAVNVGQLSGGLSSLSTSVTNSVNTQIGNLSTTVSNQISSATKNAVQYDNDAHTSVTLGGPGASGPVNLHNIADGVGNNDAVNVGQLSGAISPIQSSLSSAVSNITNLQGNVTDLSTALGTTNQSVTNLSTSLAGTQTDVSNLQAADKRNVKYDGPQGFDSVTLAGPNGTRVTNVKAGELSAASTDAVNGSQLYATNQTVAKQGDAITKIGGQVTQTATDIRNIGGQVTQNTTNIGALQQDALQWSASAGAYDASHGSGSAQKITNVAAGDISTTSTDAINGAQLKHVQDELNTQIGGATKNAVVYDTDANGNRLNSVTLSGGAAGPVAIKNVASGSLNTTSTDAVNGSQLFATNQNVATQTARVDNLTSNVSTLSSNLTTTNANVVNLQEADKLNVKYDGSDKSVVTLGGAAHAPVKVSNVADGVASSDAVNVGQLSKATGSLQQQIGAQGDTITSIDQRVTTNTTDIASLKQDALQFDPSTGAYNAAHGGSTTKIVNVADGNVAAGSKDAVNGGQLFGVKSDLEQQITNVSNQAGEAVKNVVKYDVDANGTRLNSVSLVGGDATSPVVLKNVAAGVDDTDAVNVKQLKSVQSNINQLGAMAVTYDDGSKSIITLGGGSGGTKITNVQAGTLSASSTDAVNGSQLYSTNQQVTKNTTDITNLQQDVSNVANGKAGLVQQQDPNGQITVGAGSGGTSVNFSGTAGDRVLTGVAAGTNNNDAVNVGQLNTALKIVETDQRIKAQATDANTSWISRADAGSFGSTATASGKNAVAVGQGSVADRDNSFSVGAKGSERQVTNVAAGTAPTDAVNVQQLNDNIASASAASRGYTDQRIGQVYNSFNDLKKDMYGGVASAMAVAGLPQPTAPGRSMVSAATANYHGQQGFAAGYSYVTQNEKWVVKASVTGNNRSDFGAVVGAGYQF
ncbi:YadA-like family protein [Burkholderia sp. SIMBA_043]|uniref:YadA-like family protein n=1 Tax=Burkholderia TaxID=32008 RepID=UPI0005D857E7|nr:YadA-like family protein [Burkholderia vietnamiensis]AJY08225.1 coiled stalk of trimeric autotransporter adhesin family protein [Burkholderia vietnamiensis LMG 10929]AVR14846.1 hemagglutinin [Burkholderia vietnamiensis]KVE66860.1 hemagglutinin [Burkholderia vietnamiensis]KVM49332.1 hemagglutinin [Burkholderia vietnamiensis]KVS00157.1 hemagglutinin [Burkholderia vietnamiensis]